MVLPLPAAVAFCVQPLAQAAPPCSGPALPPGGGRPRAGARGGVARPGPGSIRALGAAVGAGLFGRGGHGAAAGTGRRHLRPVGPAPLCFERPEELGAAALGPQVGRERGSGELPRAHQSEQRRRGQDMARLHSVVPGGIAGGRGYRLKHGGSLRSTRCAVKAAEHWQRWPGEAPGESPSLETFGRYRDMCLASWLQVVQL